MALFFLGMLAALAYFIFKLYRIYDPTQVEKYKYVREFLTFFGNVLLLLLFMWIEY
jgi:hypothetical protein